MYTMHIIQSCNVQHSSTDICAC